MKILSKLCPGFKSGVKCLKKRKKKSAEDTAIILKYPKNINKAENVPSHNHYT